MKCEVLAYICVFVGILDLLHLVLKVFSVSNY